MRQFVNRFAAAVVLFALLAPGIGAGAVLADDLHDMFAGNTGLADDPETPGPDLYPPRVWGADTPDMPSLVVLDAPADSALSEAPCMEGNLHPVARDHAPRAPRSREISARGPPSSS